MENQLPNNISIVDQSENLNIISKEVETALGQEILFNNWVQVCVFYPLQVHLPMVLGYLLSVLNNQSYKDLPVIIHPIKTARCQLKSSLSIEIVPANSAFNLTNTRVNFRYNESYSVQLLTTTINKNDEDLNVRKVQNSADPNYSFLVVISLDLYSVFESKGSSLRIYGLQRALLTDLQQFIKSNVKLLALGNYTLTHFPKYRMMKVIDFKEFRDVGVAKSE